MFSRLARAGLGLFLPILAFALLPCSAQQGTTSLRGSLTDPQGSVVPGAKIVLEDTERGLHLETSSNHSGSYEFLQLPPGTYHLQISAPGFKSVSREKLALQVAIPATFNTSLIVSAVAETVTVSISAVPIVKTGSPTCSRNPPISTISRRSSASRIPGNPANATFSGAPATSGLMSALEKRLKSPNGRPSASSGTRTTSPTPSTSTSELSAIICSIPPRSGNSPRRSATRASCNSVCAIVSNR